MSDSQEPEGSSESMLSDGPLFEESASREGTPSTTSAPLADPTPPPVKLSDEIRTVELDSPEILRYLVNVAIYDPDWNLKKQAFRRICEDITVDELQLEERMRLLQVLSHNEDAVTKIAPTLLLKWSTQICRDAMGSQGDDEMSGGAIPAQYLARIPWLILEKLDLIGYPKECEEAVGQLLLQSTRLVNCKNLSEYLLMIKEEIMNKMNYNRAYEEMSLQEATEKIFFWRVFVKFAICAAKDPVEKDSIKNQMLPTLLSLCEFFESFVTWATTQNDEYESHLIQIVKDLLQLLKWSDHDEYGMNAYRDLLIAVLTSEVIPVNDDIVEECVADLFLFHYPNDDDLQAAVLDICSVVETITQRDSSYEAEEAKDEKKAEIHEEPEEEDASDTDEETENPEKAPDAAYLLHSLIIVEKMMMTLRIKKRNDPVLDGLFGDIVRRGVASKNRAHRRYAFRSVTRLCCYDLDYFKTKIGVLKCALMIECPENKESLVNGISDMVVSHGYDLVANTLGIFELSSGKKMRLAEFFANLMDDSCNCSSLIPHAVVRAFSKWMVRQESSEWTQPLARMLVFCSRWDFESNRIMTSRRRLVFSFLMKYVAIGRSERVAVARALVFALDMLCTDYSKTERAHIDVDDLVVYAVKLTCAEEAVDTETTLGNKSKPGTPLKRNHKEATPKADSTQSVSAHLHLMGVMLRHMRLHADHPYTVFMAKSLSMLQLDGLKPEMQSKCDWAEQIDELLTKIVTKEHRKALPFIRAALRNLKSQFRASRRTPRKPLGGTPLATRLAQSAGATALSTIEEER